VRDALRFFVADDLFRIGSQCIRRVRGLPMGGALSPPLASWDLECSILDSLYKTKILAAHKLQKRKESPENILQFTIYVDDILCYSHSLCPQCIQGLVVQMVPADVGLEVETSSDSAAVFPFLHVELAIRRPDTNNRSFFDVRPILHTERFAFGVDPYPRVA
jgi:hypothetical protein